MINIYNKKINNSVILFNNIKKKVNKIAKLVNRNPLDIKITVITKTFQKNDILPILQHGHKIFGENKIQESKNKWIDLKKVFSNIELHLIGSLQSNKVKDAIKIFDVIETIDREKIAFLLSKEMKNINRNIRYYVQVNIGLEKQKKGILPSETIDFVNHCKKYYNLQIEGLMCIPPVEGNPSSYFLLLNKLKERLNLKYLSMGMSKDFDIAIKFGSTNIRIGSAIFGDRR